MVTQLDEKIAGLQDQVKKLLSQKDSLIKELDTIEEKYESQDRLYRKYFPVIIDMVTTGDTPFAGACKELSIALKKGASSVKIAYIFEQLKTAMIKEGIGPVAVKKKKGMFGSLLKSSTDTFIEEFKQGYHEIVNNLRSTLDAKYTTRMDNIAARILDVGDTKDIADIRDSIFALVFVYISDTSQDREKVNSFVQDIVAKILDIEQKLTTSYDQTSSLFSSNSGFETILSSEMTGLQKTSDVAFSLDDLKVQINQRLASIETALKHKQVKDKAIQAVAEKNRHIFKSGFTKLKQELNEATKYSEELEEKLNQDQLTGAFNRRAYDQKIQDEMDRFLRYGTMFSLLLIDADKFKNINDRYGHAIGDRCLQEIIKRSIPLLRRNDMLARYGGEEFVVVMPETDAVGAKEAAEKIRQTIEKIEFLYKNEKVRVTVSIGVTQVEEGDKTHTQIFERADMAVYKAKENGRNQVSVH
ncbi:MAG: GGDEF domain-containing protein [Proteobacteria bacterium]|nr:GGDEF domain-containing protein [Desulfobacula sp.]MBU4131368.1 GGDEF domain-containing protein [Pseudomonadota bacterium]